VKLGANIDFPINEMNFVMFRVVMLVSLRMAVSPSLLLNL
jgi:hypothetical protein